MTGTMAIFAAITCSQIFGPTVYYDIKYCGRIEEKYYAKGVLPDGRMIEIPIINGYAPAVTIGQTAYGEEKRTFCYDAWIKYKGGILNYYKVPNQECNCRPVLLNDPPRFEDPPKIDIPIPKPDLVPIRRPKPVEETKPLPLPEKPSVKKPAPSLTESEKKPIEKVPLLKPLDKRPVIGSFDNEAPITKSFPRY